MESVVQHTTNYTLNEKETCSVELCKIDAAKCVFKAMPSDKSYINNTTLLTYLRNIPLFVWQNHSFTLELCS